MGGWVREGLSGKGFEGQPSGAEGFEVVNQGVTRRAPGEGPDDIGGVPRAEGEYGGSGLREGSFLWSGWKPVLNWNDEAEGLISSEISVGYYQVWLNPNTGRHRWRFVPKPDAMKTSDEFEKSGLGGFPIHRLLPAEGTATSYDDGKRKCTEHMYSVIFKDMADVPHDFAATMRQRPLGAVAPIQLKNSVDRPISLVEYWGGQKDAEGFEKAVDTTTEEAVPPMSEVFTIREG